MYVAMASYVLNDNQVVLRPEEVPRLAEFIGQKLFLNQGFAESTSQDLFATYLGPDGRTRTPMVLAYEAQFIDAHRNNPTTRQMVLM